MSRSDERRKYENDVFYEAWARGLDPDRATECAEDCYYDGRSPEACVDGYASRVRAARQRSSAQEQFEQPAEDEQP